MALDVGPHHIIRANAIVAGSNLSPVILFAFHEKDRTYSDYASDFRDNVMRIACASPESYQSYRKFTVYNVSFMSNDSMDHILLTPLVKELLHYSVVISDLDISVAF